MTLIFFGNAQDATPWVEAQWPDGMTHSAECHSGLTPKETVAEVSLQTISNHDVTAYACTHVAGNATAGPNSQTAATL